MYVSYVFYLHSISYASFFDDPFPITSSPEIIHARNFIFISDVCFIESSSITSIFCAFSNVFFFFLRFIMMKFL